VNWNEYQQQALTTAIYPLKRELEYTVLGLCSEAGELGMAYMEGKQQHWGFNQSLVTAALKEAGDVYWYVAAVADALKYNLHDVWDRSVDGIETHASRGFTVVQLNGVVAEIAGIVKKAIRDNEGFLSAEGQLKIANHLHHTLVLLNNLVYLFGSTPEAVTAKNLNKLADRKARGVLQGSGDNR
jgi:NTP pyrophosphatase (non-canonical NTP hydrolase)